MTWVVLPGKNKRVRDAFAGLRKEQRAEKKAKPAETEENAGSHAARARRPLTSVKKTAAKKAKAK